MTWKEWILVCLFANCLSAAPDKYYSYDVLEKKGGYASDDDDDAYGFHGREYKLYDGPARSGGYDHSSDYDSDSDSRGYSKSDDSHGHGYGYGHDGYYQKYPKVKPKVIIVKKIIPLSTTTFIG